MTESSKLKNAMAEFGGMGTTSAQGGPGGKRLDKCKKQFTFLFESWWCASSVCADCFLGKGISFQTSQFLDRGWVSFDWLLLLLSLTYLFWALKVICWGTKWWEISSSKWVMTKIFLCRYKGWSNLQDVIISPRNRWNDVCVWWLSQTSRKFCYARRGFGSSTDDCCSCSNCRG